MEILNATNRAAIQKYLICNFCIIILGFGVISQTTANKLPGEVDSVLQLVATQDDNTGKIDNILLLARKYTYIDKDSAMMFAKQAHALSYQLSYSKGQLDALYRKGLIQKLRCDFSTSFQYFTEFLKLSKELQDSSSMTKGYFQHGILYRLKGKDRIALYYHNKSLAIDLALRDTFGVFSNYNSMGNVFQNIGEYDSAMVYYMKTIRLCIEKVEYERHLATIYHNLGEVYKDLKDYDNARKYLNMAMEYATRFKKNKDLAQTYTKLGNLANEEEKLDSAFYFYKLAEPLHKQIKNERGVNDLYINYGIVFSKKGLYSMAFDNFTRALVYYKIQDDKEGVISAWQNMAKLYKKQKKFSLALTTLDSCNRLADSTGFKKERLSVLMLISDIYYESGKFKRSREYLTKYIALKDSIYKLDKEEIVSDLRIQYDRDLDQLKILELEYENLRKTKQRNIYFFVGLGIVVLSLFIMLYLRLTARKNRIIAEQRITQLEEEKKLLAARFLVEGQEEERKRIAKELHDGLGVLLSVTKMQFSAIKDISPENRPLIEKATQFLEQASGDVRKISHNMMPGLLTKLGLCEALEDLFEKLSDTEGIQAICEIEGAKERLPENKEIMLYRIIQEMVNNTLKHAEATEIELQINVHHDRLDIRFTDNGKGFKVEEGIEQKSMGLQSIWSRVKFLDGTISIESAPGKGTMYTMQIPV